MLKDQKLASVPQYRRKLSQNGTLFSPVVVSFLQFSPQKYQKAFRFTVLHPPPPISLALLKATPFRLFTRRLILQSIPLQELSITIRLPAAPLLVDLASGYGFWTVKILRNVARLGKVARLGRERRLAICWRLCINMISRFLWKITINIDLLTRTGRNAEIESSNFNASLAPHTPDSTRWWCFIISLLMIYHHPHDTIVV